MSSIKELFEEYKQRAQALKAEKPHDLNGKLIALENQMADASDLGERDRLETRAYMEEYRRKIVDGYEAGAQSPPISEPWSGPRQGEYDDVNG